MFSSIFRFIITVLAVFSITYKAYALSSTIEINLGVLEDLKIKKLPVTTEKKPVNPVVTKKAVVKPQPKAKPQKQVQSQSKISDEVVQQPAEIKEKSKEISTPPMTIIPEYHLEQFNKSKQQDKNLDINKNIMLPEMPSSEVYNNIDSSVPPITPKINEAISTLKDKKPEEVNPPQASDAVNSKSSWYNKLPVIGKDKGAVKELEQTTIEQGSNPEVKLPSPISTPIQDNNITNSTENNADDVEELVHEVDIDNHNEFIMPQDLIGVGQEETILPKELPQNTGDNEFIMPEEIKTLPYPMPIDPPAKDQKMPDPLPAPPAIEVEKPGNDNKDKLILPPLSSSQSSINMISFAYRELNAELQEKERQALLTSVKTMLEQKNDENHKIKIIAYSANKEDNASSRKLALQRVIFARKFLMENGVDVNKINIQVINSDNNTNLAKIDLMH